MTARRAAAVLGCPLAEVAADFGEGPFDADDAFLRLVAVEVEGDEFPDASAGVYRESDYASRGRASSQTGPPRAVIRRRDACSSPETCVKV